MDAQEIRDIIGVRTGGFWGIRGLCDDEDYTVGGEVRESYEWDYEADCSTYQTTGQTMGQSYRDGAKAGVCTIGIVDPEDLESIAQAMEAVRLYSDRFALLHADDVEYGNDDSEWILFGDWFHPVEIEAVWTDGEVA